MKQTTTYWCDTCGTAVSMNSYQFKKHLKEVHHIDVIRGTRKAVTFLDGAKGYYLQTYSMDLEGGVKAIQQIEGGGT
jgi:hypothetical protein